MVSALNIQPTQKSLSVVCSSRANLLLGERVGCVLAVTNSEQNAENSQSMLEQFQRSEVSNPPAYGAKIASKIVETEELRQSWFEDMKTMSGRIAEMRKQLYDRLVALGTHFNLLI